MALTFEQAKAKAEQLAKMYPEEWFVVAYVWNQTNTAREYIVSERDDYYLFYNDDKGQDIELLVESYDGEFTYQ